MGKKKLRAKYESKGGLGGRFTAGGNIGKDGLTTAVNKWEAFKSGKPAYVTIPNPNPLETNKRWIRVKMADQYGAFRKY